MAGPASLVRLRKHIVCVDSGFRNTGIAVWDTRSRRFVFTHVVHMPKGDFDYVHQETSHVVSNVSAFLASVFERYDPLFALAELPVGGARSARAAYCMGVAFATVVATCKVSNVKLISVRPNDIKDWARYSGRKAVPKEVVIKRVSQVFGTRLLPEKKDRVEHVADAMACLGVYLSQYE